MPQVNDLHWLFLSLKFVLLLTLLVLCMSSLYLSVVSCYNVSAKLSFFSNFL